MTTRYPAATHVGGRRLTGDSCRIPYRTTLVPSQGAALTARQSSPSDGAQPEDDAEHG